MGTLGFLTVWFFGTIIVGILAEQRGRSAVGWCLLSFFVLSPLFCGLLVAVLPRKGLSERDQLLFDAMPAEQKLRVIEARIERQKSGWQRMREERDARAKREEQRRNDFDGETA